MSNLPALATVDTFIDQVICCEAETLARSLPDNSINAVICSPPYYGLRSYLPDDHADKGREIGLEDTHNPNVERLVAVFCEIRRVLRDDGVVWLNLGDSYAGNATGSDTTKSGLGGGKTTQTVAGKRIDKRGDGLKPKDLIGIPWRVAFALQADGWYLRSDIIWSRPNPMPESVRDRPTKSHEYIFLLTKSERYWYDADAIAEPAVSGANGNTFTAGKTLAAAEAQRPVGRGPRVDGPTRNKRTVWTVPTSPSSLPHFAMFPQALIEPMVLAGCPAQVCAVCGAPYERVVEREPMEVRHSGRAAQMGEYGRTCTSGTMTKPPMTHTLGWRATCSCAANTRPGTVYDPFMGSGTTGLVAQRLGRHYIGTDINREYVELARTRLRYRGDDSRMVREQRAGVEQIALFG